MRIPHPDVRYKQPEMQVQLTVQVMQWSVGPNCIWIQTLSSVTGPSPETSSGGGDDGGSSATAVVSAT